MRRSHRLLGDGGVVRRGVSRQFRNPKRGRAAVTVCSTRSCPWAARGKRCQSRAAIAGIALHSLRKRNECRDAEQSFITRRLFGTGA